MPRYRITLAYDGTDFEGWQVQANRGRPQEPRTIQGVVEEAVGRLSDGQPIRIVGAGRTDAGVHALGQVASFALSREMNADDLTRALNGLLPFDVRVLRSDRVADTFDARRDALRKLYRYELDLGPVQLPTRRRVAAHHRGPLDPARVGEAAALYLGRHDFASVASSGSSVKTTVRTVLRSEARFFEDEMPRMTYEVVADGFLRKMVRSLVGGLLAAGSGATTVAELKHALERGDRRVWPAPAEARGLSLVRVAYSDSPDLQ